MWQCASYGSPWGFRLGYLGGPYTSGIRTPGLPDALTPDSLRFLRLERVEKGLRVGRADAQWRRMAHRVPGAPPASRPLGTVLVLAFLLQCVAEGGGKCGVCHIVGPDRDRIAVTQVLHCLFNDLRCEDCGHAVGA